MSRRQNHTARKPGAHLQLVRVETREERAQLREVAEACAVEFPSSVPCFSAQVVVALLDVIDRKAA